MLTGSSLLDFVKQNPTMPKDDLLKSTGYYTTREDGKVSYKTSEFMSQLLAAQGINITPAKSSGGMGRQLSYKTKVMPNHNCVLGKSYFEEAKAGPGSSYEIIVESKMITLKPIK